MVFSIPIDLIGQFHVNPPQRTLLHRRGDAKSNEERSPSFFSASASSMVIFLGVVPVSFHETDEGKSVRGHGLSELYVYFIISCLPAVPVNGLRGI